MPDDRTRNGEAATPPEGDGEGAPDMRAPDGRTPDEIRRFDRALALFEAGAWFTCHEVLEHLWLDETRPERDVYKGILQIAVGLLHEENGNRTGALRLLERGAGHLVPFLSVKFGVDLAALRDEALRLRAMLAELPPDQRLDAGQWKTLLPRVSRTVWVKDNENAGHERVRR